MRFKATKDTRKYQWLVLMFLVIYTIYASFLVLSRYRVELPVPVSEFSVAPQDAVVSEASS
jgi:hypothetical protein